MVHRKYYCIIKKILGVCGMEFLIENGVLIKVIAPELSVIIQDSVRIIWREAFLGCECRNT